MRYIVLGYVMHSLRKHILTLTTITCAFTFITGCTTNYYINENQYQNKTEYKRKTVFVTNPEHPHYELLKRSKIYTLSEEKGNDTTLTIEGLSHAGIPIYCGLGIFTTLGIIPNICSYNQNFSYILETDTKSSAYVHKLPYYSRISLWETFLLPFAHSQPRAQAKALSMSERKVCDEKSCQ